VLVYYFCVKLKDICVGEGTSGVGSQHEGEDRSRATGVYRYPDSSEDEEYSFTHENENLEKRVRLDQPASTGKYSYMGSLT
jgi:hypothetical protein